LLEYYSFGEEDKFRPIYNEIVKRIHLPNCDFNCSCGYAEVK
jgi:hypothetical protein